MSIWLIEILCIISVVITRIINLKIIYTTFNSETVWKFRARHQEIWGQRDPMVTFGHAPTFTGSNAAIVHSYDGEN